MFELILCSSVWHVIDEHITGWYLTWHYLLMFISDVTEPMNISGQDTRGAVRICSSVTLQPTNINGFRNCPIHFVFPPFPSYFSSFPIPFSHTSPPPPLTSPPQEPTMHRRRTRLPRVTAWSDASTHHLHQGASTTPVVDVRSWPAPWPRLNDPDMPLPLRPAPEWTRLRRSGQGPQCPLMSPTPPPEVRRRWPLLPLRTKSCEI
jgi:hypothetical protein